VFFPHPGCPHKIKDEILPDAIIRASGAFSSSKSIDLPPHPKRMVTFYQPEVPRLIVEIEKN
jgi:hypothetical protein